MASDRNNNNVGYNMGTKCMPIILYIAHNFGSHGRLYTRDIYK